jgi:hypothetical protein
MIRRLLVALLLVVPSIAVAQRGGGRTQSDRKTPLFDKEDAFKGPAIRVRDIEDLSPIKLLIDKRKDLKLTDAQLAQFKDAEGKLKEKNAPLFKAVDSLVHEMRNAGAQSSDEARARGRNAREGLMEAIKDARGNYDASAKEAVAQLDADQQTKANEMIEKQRVEGDKTIRERLSGGERGGERP